MRTRTWSGVYRALADDTENVIAQLRLLASEHQDAGAAAYYQVRDEIFNPQRRTRQDGQVSSYPAHLAAMFIYLNRTGYNGLFRLNSQGDFNVPVGRYATPRICDEPTLRAVAAVLDIPIGRPCITARSRPLPDPLVPGTRCTSIRPTRRSAPRRDSRRTPPGIFRKKTSGRCRKWWWSLAGAGLFGDRQQFHGGRREPTLSGARSAPGRPQDLPHPRAAGNQLSGRAQGARSTNTSSVTSGQKLDWDQGPTPYGNYVTLRSPEHQALGKRRRGQRALAHLVGGHQLEAGPALITNTRPSSLAK